MNGLDTIMSECARTVCNHKAKYRIFNNPSTVEGYREYCTSCWRGIIKYNPELKHERIENGSDSGTT